MSKKLIVSFFILLVSCSAFTQIELFKSTPEAVDINLLQNDLTNSPSSFASNLFEALDQTFDDITSNSSIHGFNVAMKVPDGSIWKRATGIAQALPDTIALTTDHLISMASITKSFTAATLLLLYEEGLLDLEDPISDYIGPYPNVNGSASIRQLLNHRSGIHDFHTDFTDIINNNLDSIWTIDNALQHVQEEYFPPGTGWHYSNNNYLLAGRIIEVITGQPWYETVRERIIDPLGLTHTIAYPFDSLNGLLLSNAFSYWDNNEIIDLQGAGVQIDGGFSAYSSAACLFTTPEDLAHFSQQLHGGYLLQPATLAEMQTDYRMQPQFGIYGLGATSINTPSNLENWGHDGNVLYVSLAFYFPDKNISLAVQQNDSRFGSGYIDLFEVFNALLDTYCDYIATSNHEVAWIEEGPVIFPNPTKGIIKIEGNKLNDWGISVRDITGRQMKNYQLINLEEIDISHFPIGFYFLELRNKNQDLIIKKIIKE